MIIFRAELSIPAVSYCDYVWDNLEQHSHLPGLVCGLTGETLLHGEVEKSGIIIHIFQLTYYCLQIKETALKVARSLQSMGLRRGGVLILFRNLFRAL